MQHALQKAQALGITPQAESQHQHLKLPPRVLRLQQYGCDAGESSAFLQLPAPHKLHIMVFIHCTLHLLLAGQAQCSIVLRRWSI